MEIQLKKGTKLGLGIGAVLASDATVELPCDSLGHAAELLSVAGIKGVDLSYITKVDGRQIKTYFGAGGKEFTVDVTPEKKVEKPKPAPKVVKAAPKKVEPKKVVKKVAAKKAALKK